MCQYPELQEKAYQEVHEVLGDRQPTVEDFPKLKYVKAILDETLRLRPIAPNLVLRQSTEDG
jgi:cytochrome P450